MLSWNLIAKFLFLWLVGILIKEHHEFMRKKKQRWPFRQHNSAA